MQTGYMIAVEGTDKSGKHTQVMNIINYLRERRISAETLDFPQYNAGQVTIPATNITMVA